LILVEGEFWPNLIRLADRQGIPISLINGRMSSSSYKGYRKLKSLTADVLRRIDPICVQGEIDAERMIGIGAPPDQVHVMGTAKFDVAERDPVAEKATQKIMQRIGIEDDAIVLLGGSTWPGEEAVLCSIYKKLKAENDKLFLVMVPRHVERADEVIECFRQHDLTFLRRSQLEDDGGRERPDVLFVDTTGELRSFYSVADIIFVGKSLLEHGGQNPIEPALCGKAIVVGPNMENFPAVMPLFIKNDALLQVPDAQSLESTIRSLLSDEAMRIAIGQRAERLVTQNQGTIERTIERLNGE
ncbi:MAG: glycosyltransferase, partial [Kiritimatiellales bacterium]|nr:glycosyltransferase [Kiritimatiellales bacterium]